MKIQQAFDEGMTSEQKANHVQEWFTHLSGSGFNVDTFYLFQITAKGIEKLEYKNGSPADAIRLYESADGYHITAKPI